MGGRTMAEESATKNLGLPLILGSDYVMRDKINDSIKTMDNVVLPKSHANSKAHFDMWKPNIAYKIQDVIKTSTCPSWGFYMCTVAGISGAAEPQGYGENDIVTDGTITWALKLFGGSTKISHDKLLGRNLENQHPITAITGLQDTIDTVEKKSNDYTDTKIIELVNGAPGMLDTLKELADQLGRDSDAVATIANALGKKVDKENGKSLSTNDYTNEEKSKLEKIVVTGNVNLDNMSKFSHTHDNKGVLDNLGKNEKNELLHSNQVMCTKKDAMKFALIF
jgi:hypothetical protein